MFPPSLYIILLVVHTLKIIEAELSWNRKRNSHTLEILKQDVVTNKSLWKE